MFIAPRHPRHPAPLGAACKLNMPRHIALLRSAEPYLKHEAINILLLRSKDSRTLIDTFCAKLSTGVDKLHPMV